MYLKSKFLLILMTGRCIGLLYRCLLVDDFAYWCIN